MNAVVVFDSKFGNTERIAHAIGRALEQDYQVQVHPVAEQPALPAGLDLLVVGGPTHAHGLSQPMRTFLATLVAHQLRGVAALAFDTRFRMHPLLSGRAAPKIARALQKQGANVLLPPESFFVLRTDGHPLEPDEADRATAWAKAALATLAIPL